MFSLYLPHYPNTLDTVKEYVQKLHERNKKVSNYTAKDYLLIFITKAKLSSFTKNQLQALYDVFPDSIYKKIESVFTYQSYVRITFENSYIIINTEDCWLKSNDGNIQIKFDDKNFESILNVIHFLNPNPIAKDPVHGIKGYLIFSKLKSM